MLIRQATLDDLSAICEFVDYWLAGRGYREKAPGAVKDCFIPPGQHRRYIQRYTTLLVIIDGKVVGWSVKHFNGSLLHLLIAGTHRGRGLGSMLLSAANAPIVRCKSNQSTGDPGPFYVKHGYVKVGETASRRRIDIDRIQPERPKIIHIYERQDNS